MTNKITDLENQPQQHTSSIIKDLDQLQTLSEEELQGVVGGCHFQSLVNLSASNGDGDDDIFGGGGNDTLNIG